MPNPPTRQAKSLGQINDELGFNRPWFNLRVILRNLALRTNPLFYWYRGLNHAHWKLWRLSVANIGALRKRMMALQLELECEGSPVAKRIKKILESQD